MKGSGWEMWTTPEGTQRLSVVLTAEDGMRMDREALEMLEDAVFLIQAAFRGKTEGPLRLPSGMMAR